jgi:hypothetical protein
MPKPRSMSEDKSEPLIHSEETGNGHVAIKPQPDRSHSRSVKEKKSAWRIRLPKLNLRKDRSDTSSNTPSTNGRMEIPPPEEVQSVNGTAIPAVPKDATPRSKRSARRRVSLRTVLKELIVRPRIPPSGPKKPKRKKTHTKRGRGIRVLLVVMIFFIGPMGFVLGRAALSKIGTEKHARKTSDARMEGQLKVLGASSDFPLSTAVATARRMAYECFTIPNYGANSADDDLVTFQDKALANAGIAAGDNVNCGWNGKGRGMVADMQVVSDQYWLHADHATVILQLKMYQRPGFFYYYVPFRNRNGVPKISGMPAIFGTSSGAEDFLATCPDPPDSANDDELRHTAQLFVDGLAGDSSIDLGYLTYAGAKFGGFGPSVSSPKITQLKYCGAKGQERQFAALVQFKGPVQGSHYSLPYGFGVVPNPETSGKYQVKEFGPAPGYAGS